MDDVIKLMSPGEPTYDEAGNEKPNIEYRTVFCQVRSVARSEYYQAAQHGLHPSVTFVISNGADYNGEKQLQWTDPKGKPHIYDVIRTYQAPNSDEVELIAEERIRDNGEDRVCISADGEDS